MPEEETPEPIWPATETLVTVHVPSDTQMNRNILDGRPPLDWGALCAGQTVH